MCLLPVLRPMHHLLPLSNPCPCSLDEGLVFDHYCHHSYGSQPFTASTRMGQDGHRHCHRCHFCQLPASPIFDPQCASVGQDQRCWPQCATLFAKVCHTLAKLRHTMPQSGSGRRRTNSTLPQSSRSIKVFQIVWFKLSF